MFDINVLCTGNFDILHIGHVRLFEFAKKLGHFLIIAIDSDKKIKEDKGLARPFNNQIDRVEVLKSIKYIDEVLLFDNQEDLESICFYYFPIRVLGSDYKNKEIVGENFCKKIIFFNRIEPHSTTRILNGK